MASTVRPNPAAYELWKPACNSYGERCYQAALSNDARFDGRFFTAVKTTGIYCRSICPARMPLRRNIEFHPTAAAGPMLLPAPRPGKAPRLLCPAR